MIIKEEGLKMEDGVAYINCCLNCYVPLFLYKTPHILPFSLANNLSVGDVPDF